MMRRFLWGHLFTLTYVTMAVLVVVALYGRHPAS